VSAVTQARGLDKLKFVPDRGMAANLYKLYFLVNSRASDAAFQREVAREQERKLTEWRDWLIDMGVKSLNGDFGEWLKKSARGILLTDKGEPKKDDATLRYWEQEFKRGRQMERDR
jgi:hypothetical protein